MPYKDPEAKRAYYREYKKRPGARATNNAWAKAKVAKVRERVAVIKRSTPCSDCGLLFHHSQVDFDHLPEFDKARNVSTLIDRKSSWLDIEAEIAKCEVVCANCHRLRTWTRNHPNDFD